MGRGDTVHVQNDDVPHLNENLFPFFFFRSIGTGSNSNRPEGRSAYLPELSNPSIDPQRVGRDAGNSVAWLAQLPQGGSTRRRGRVQRATTSGTTAR